MGIAGKNVMGFFCKTKHLTENRYVNYDKMNWLPCLQANLSSYCARRTTADRSSRNMKIEMDFAAGFGTQVYSERKR